MDTLNWLNSLRYVGNYREFFMPRPTRIKSIREFISPEPYPEKEAVLAHLRAGETIYFSPGELPADAFTGGLIGCYDEMVTDGVHRWQRQVEYYVEKYNLRLEPEFVAYVMAQQKQPA